MKDSYAKEFRNFVFPVPVRGSQSPDRAYARPDEPRGVVATGGAEGTPSPRRGQPWLFQDENRRQKKARESRAFFIRA